MLSYKITSQSKTKIITIVKYYHRIGLVKDFRQKLKNLSFTFLTFVQTEIIPTNDAITMATFYKDTSTIY